MESGKSFPETEEEVGRKRRLYPPHVLFLAIVCMKVVDLLFFREIFSSIYFVYLGALVAILGIALVIHCRKLFFAADTEITPFKESSSLIVSGAYRYSRNPIYLGMLMVIFGVALEFNNVATLLVPLAFFIWIRQCFVLPEERMMEETHGVEFENYRSAVRRWL